MNYYFYISGTGNLQQKTMHTYVSPESAHLLRPCCLASPEVYEPFHNPLQLIRRGGVYCVPPALRQRGRPLHRAETETNQTGGVARMGTSSHFGTVLINR